MEETQETIVPVQHLLPSVFLLTELSETGWGEHLQKLHAAGEWLSLELDHHINYLETRAVLLALMALQKEILTGIHHSLVLETDML